MKDHRAILLSLALHLSLILALFLKMPSSPRKLEFPKSIPVSIVPIGQITQSPKAPPLSAEKKPEYKVPPKEKEEIKKPEIKKPKIPEKTFLEKVKNLVPKKELTPEKPKESPKKVTPKAEKKIEKKEDLFGSILDSVKDFKKEAPKTDAPPSLNFDAANIADKLSMSELDALRQQLRSAWYIPVGVAEENTTIEVRVEIGPDARVKKVTVLNEAEGAKKKFFQVAVDSVKQALLSPECIPLKLPKDRYDEWKVSIFVFSPKGIL
jgi:hypothetical protein